MRIVMAIAFLFCSCLALLVLASGQTSTGDDLSQALVNHGMDQGTALVAAAGLEAAVANQNIFLKRVADNEAAVADLKTRVSSLEAKLAPPPAPASVYALAFSLAADRSAAAPLAGATVHGSIYIFTAPSANLATVNPAGVTAACYWLDNTTASGTATHCEGSPPWDFQGGLAGGAAIPWNTASVPNGAHTITQKVTDAAASETTTANFIVAN